MDNNNSEINIKIKNLLTKIKTEKNSRTLYIELGLELTKINMIEQALNCFNRANQIKEDYLSLYNSACLNYRKNDYKTALLQLEKARMLNPDFTMISILAGICYSRLNNIKAAESNFVNILMNDPSNRTALTALSILFHNQGRIVESLNLVNRLTSLYKPGIKLIKFKTQLIKESINQSSKPFYEKQEGYAEYDKYIKSLPVDIYTDKYGTINEKIKKLEKQPDKKTENLISLSLCQLFSGNTDSALEYLLAAKSSKAS